MAYTRDWDEAKPIDHKKFIEIPGTVRGTKTDVAERLKELIYGFISGETDQYKVKKIPLKEQSVNPASEVSVGVLFTKNVNNITELFYLDSSGNLKQLTTGGKLNVEATEAVLLSGDQTVGGIKTFTSIPVLPASNPTADNEATRKAYVDTQISSHVTNRHSGNYAFVKNATDFSTTSTSWVTMLSVNITTHGNPVLIIGQASHTGAIGSGQLDDFRIRISRDEVELGVYGAVKPDDHKGGNCIFCINVPSAGTYTYKLQGKCVGQVGNGFYAHSGHLQLVVIELGY